MPGSESHHRSHCQGCGAPLSGPFCAQCGQHDVDYNRSFWHVIEDALEGFLHFDGKFFKSARYIFTRPGFLTNEFIAGRRSQYANPVRFYVFASFLFFAVSVLMGNRPAPAGSPAVNLGTTTKVAGAAEGTAKADPDVTAARTAPEAKAATGSGVRVTSEKGVKQSWLDDPLRITSDSMDEVALKQLKAEVWHLLPEMLFLCLPLLALVLKLVYFRTGRFYIEHVIFALHVQALAFLSFIVIKAGGLLGSLVGKSVESGVGTVLLLGMFYLIFRAVRTVYGQGRLKTALKFVLVGACYGSILLFGLIRLVTTSTYLVLRAG